MEGRGREIRRRGRDSSIDPCLTARETERGEREGEDVATEGEREI